MNVKSWLIATYWITCAVLTHIPPQEITPLPNQWDKVIHFSMFTILAWLLQHRVASAKHVLMILLVYAGLDELTQPIFLRTAEWLDFVADACGIGTGIIMFRVYRLGFMLK